MQDGINGVIPYERLSKPVQKMRDFYAMKPDAPIYQREFGYYVLDRWIDEGHLEPQENKEDYDKYLRQVFRYDEPAFCRVYGLGFCEAGFFPSYDVEILEDRGEYELVRDFAGRSVLCFKGRRNGFMPEYVDHPVKDMKTWEEDVKWRLDPNTPGRIDARRDELENAVKAAKQGHIMVQGLVGGYMYLRSLIGPEGLLYMTYDNPELIHDCMQTWFTLADKVIEHHQKFISFDELFLGEDICYKSGALISPDMMREFLLPYYEQLYTNMKRRAIDKTRTIHLQIDTDGNCEGVIPIYRSIGCDFMSPFEVASDCDVVKLGREHPWMLMSGGIDKRVLSQGREAIDRHLDYIMPAMKKRGGFIPTCDHGVPEEVSFENYMYFREQMLQYS